MVLLDLEVVSRLQVEPEPVGRREVSGQPQRGVCGDPALAADDLVDPPWGDTDGDSQPLLGDLQRDEELLEENLPGWIGAMVAMCVCLLLVVVDDFDVVGAGWGPDEADAPLLVVADAVLPDAVPLEASSRFPGGTLRSSRTSAASSMTSLRRAVRSMRGSTFLVPCRAQSAQQASQLLRERLLHLHRMWGER